MERRIPLIRKPLWESVEEGNREQALEAVALADITAIMRQVGHLAAHACSVFGELQDEINTVATRTAAVAARLDAVHSRMSTSSGAHLPVPPPMQKQGHAATHVAPREEPPPLPSAVGMLVSSLEPPAVAASLDRCRPPPAFDSLEDYVGAEEAPCSLRYSLSDMRGFKHRAANADPRSQGHGRYNLAVSITDNSYRQGDDGTPRPGDSPGIPQAEPGGDSPTIGRRPAADATPLSIFTSKGPQEVNVPRPTAAVEEEEEDAFYSPANRTPTGAVAAAFKTPSEWDAVSESSAKDDLNTPMACASPTVPGRGQPAMDPSNPFISQDVVSPRSPSMSSEAATEVTLSNFHGDDLPPPPVSCSSPQRRNGGKGGPAEDNPSPIVPHHSASPRAKQVNLDPSESPQPSLQPHSPAPSPATTKAGAASPPPPPPLPSKNAPSSKGKAGGPPPPPPPPPPSALKSANKAATASVPAPPPPPSNLTFSPSQLMAGRAKLKSAPRQPAHGEGTATPSSATRSSAPPAGGSGAISVADLQAGMAKLRKPPMEASGPEEAGSKGANKGSVATNPHAKMMEMIRSGNVHLRKTPSSTPPGGHSPQAQSPQSGTTPGSNHMAALLNKVQAIRMSTQADDDDSDNSWED
eukprot:CAMPEP_0117677808 /NCGR_PEP_ID=MMETSP0804-20121206/16941_1 /TAXON_ID=1074897 /ORGANISM="Tetraselmis astigmatica, Strain CCMP880" /LENGTH=636 /DNA_ID=CAMNT_0005487113 /DNA_START=58 /DNA_END=1968 /DNA_ORIENTATION=-